MAMQTLYVYTQFLNTLTNKEIDLNSDELKVMLVSSAYTPNKDTDKYKSNVVGEATGEGYIVGGITLTNVQYSIDGVTATLRADNPKWGELNIRNLRYVVLYDNTPATDDAKPLLCYIDMGETLNIINAELEVVWHLNGIMRFTIR